MPHLIADPLWQSSIQQPLCRFTPEHVALAAAERFVQYSQEAITNHGRFSVALSGGNTPKRVYELLTTERFRNRVEWSSVYLFFGDERCVPPDHPDSNYALAYETLISRVAIPAKNVHRIIGEGNPTANAAAYEHELRTFFAGQLVAALRSGFAGNGRRRTYGFPISG